MQACVLPATGKYAQLAYTRLFRYHDEWLLAWACFARPAASQLGDSWQACLYLTLTRHAILGLAKKYKKINF